MEAGNILSITGFVTRQMNLQGKTLEEIERALGYHKGRLRQGAAFLVALELPTPDKFELAGFSQVAGHHTLQQYGNINNPTDPMLAQKKHMAASLWALHGINRLVKVIPLIGHNDQMRDDDQYPPGAGIQQWRLTAQLRFRVEAIVRDYPSGRFIPTQGYQAVKYR